MHEKMRDNIYSLGIKNLFSTFKSQIIALLVGVVLSFILPIVIGIEQFGYWQVYLLYVTFAMFYGLGFTDGIYLIYGSYDYEDLPYEKLRSTLRVYTITAFIFTLLALLLTFMEKDSNKQFALMAASLNIFLLLLSNAAISILQVTNRIREYSFIVAFSKLMLLILIVLLIVLNVCNFKTIIAVDLFTKAVVLTINIFLLKDVFFGKSSNFNAAIKDWFLNVRTGIMIMLAVYASTFVMNVGRIVIERFEGIRIYSSYALSISISSFFLIFVGAFSLSFYPFLMRINQIKLPKVYDKTNKFLFFVSFVMLGFYYPLTFIIHYWYRDYIGVIQYLPFFLIMTLMQGKEQFLHITYMKALRKEHLLLLYNLVFTIIASTIIIPLYFLTRSVYWVALITSLLIIIKSYSFEYYLRKKRLDLDFKNVLPELMLVVFFVFTTTFTEVLLGLLLFVLVVIIQYLLNRSFLISFAKRLYSEFRS